MFIIKCKMCGGDIELSADKTFGTCEYCGSVMTLPKIDDNQRAVSFNRGNHFRRMGDFDKALAIYERIIAEDNTDAEAHWCCALCRFGIEYVEDPTTYEWHPTCHRASFDSYLEDIDYLAALEYSDGITRRQYQKEAIKIAEVQRGIIHTSQQEEPFDVFICYKESDENGDRTVDSTLAQDIYYQLTEKGYRVFFSRVTLEDKAGTEYEPYIFAALNSSKVMIVVGTKSEYFNAVWVKNEWSRFLALMRKERSRLLLPCYRDVDPYELPEQLSVLQSYDMAKIGFLQDLIRGVSKVLDANKEQTVVKETVVIQNETNSNVIALLKRGDMALEDGEWEKANDFFEQVLSQDAECAQAYLGKVLVKHRCRKKADLEDVSDDLGIGKRSDIIRAMQYAEGELFEWLESLWKKYNETERKMEASRVNIYNQRLKMGASPVYLRTTGRLGLLDRDWVKVALGVCSNGTVMTSMKVSSRSLNEREQQNFQKDVNKARTIVEDVGKWTNILALALPPHFTFSFVVGLQSNGKVFVSTTDINRIYCNHKYNLDTTHWRDIVNISASSHHIVGVKSDGSVEATGLNINGQCDVSDWNNVVAVSTGDNHTVGLKIDGTVVATGLNSKGQCNVSEWKDIVAVEAFRNTTVGLMSDGTITSTDKYTLNRLNRYNDVISIIPDNDIVLISDGTVSDSDFNGTTDIIAMCSCLGYSNKVIRNTLILTVDGSVSSRGDVPDISGWQLFDPNDPVLEELKQCLEKGKRRVAETEQRKESERQRIRSEKRSALLRKKAKLQEELSNLKGLFVGKKRKELQEKIMKIDQKLSKL